MFAEPLHSTARERWIDTSSAAALLRARIIDVENRRILISRIADSDQAADLTLPPNCGGFGRIHHFRRQTANGWPKNPLPIDPACNALNAAPTDLLQVQAFQNAACAWRCWYCFVPFSMLAGSTKRAAWMSADELVELYLAEPHRARVIDLTGGSPDLTPEWALWMMRALRARGLEREVYLWSDDNLSTDYLWRFLSAADRGEMAAYRLYGRVACFKGFDAASFAFNTQASPDAFDAQFDFMGRLLAEDFDCYGYATFTADNDAGLAPSMRKFVDRLQRLHNNFPLRLVPLRIEQFSPVGPRLNERRYKALSIQDSAISAWNYELSRRFTSKEREAAIHEVDCGRS